MQGWTNDDRQAKERMISDHFPSKSVDSFKTQTQKKKEEEEDRGSTHVHVYL